MNAICKENEMHATMVRNITNLWINQEVTTEEYLKELEELERIHKARINKIKED